MHFFFRNPDSFRRWWDISCNFQHRSGDWHWSPCCPSQPRRSHFRPRRSHHHPRFRHLHRRLRHDRSPQHSIILQVSLSSSSTLPTQQNTDQIWLSVNPIQLHMHPNTRYMNMHGQQKHHVNKEFIHIENTHLTNCCSHMTTWYVNVYTSRLFENTCNHINEGLITIRFIQ